MELTQEPIIENGICKRCERNLRILSNGLCSRCDGVLYGKPTEKIYFPSSPKQIPIIHYPVFPRRTQIWCSHLLKG